MSPLSSFPLRWDLSSCFKDDEIQAVIAHLDLQLTDLENSDLSSLQKALLLSQDIAAELAGLEALAHCLFAEDTSNTFCLSLQEKTRAFQARLENASTLIDKTLRTLDRSTVDQLCSACPSIAFAIQERHQLAQQKLSHESETLITNLSIDGYHGYSQLFSILHGSLRFPWNTTEGPTTLSVGQIDNLLNSSERKTRQDAFLCYKTLFAQHQAQFAEVLNHLAGFRLQVYRERNWNSILHEPLTANRMQKNTLECMWATINDNLAPFMQYLKKKASLFGIEHLSWHDVNAPLVASQTLIPYENACKSIISQFSYHSPSMGSFAKKALSSKWIEAENRSHKAAGGFCIAFPNHRQSRIFMTYQGTQDNVSTLAHELGHAYHNEKIFHHPYFSQNIKMNVAETASTMAEMILADAMLRQASNPQDKLALLDHKLSSSVAFFMNIQSRFLFEQAFYEERKQGYVLPERLSTLMEQAQKQAYGNALGEWHPLFWASKMHFYFTDVPFYNFPYTFGYLFSLGLYTLLKQDLPSFEKRYDALLNDTPLMTTEDLAKKHLDVDLAQPTFWKMAMQEAIKDVHLFLQLT